MLENDGPVKNPDPEPVNILLLIITDALLEVEIATCEVDCGAK